MGKNDSGRRGLSDEEKKRRGTFRQDTSEEAKLARKAENVVTGPWLSSIPEPSLPLSDSGRKKYDELTSMLFEQNKLTLVTQMRAESAASLWGKIHRLTAEGKEPSAADWTQFQRALDALGIAENAKPIANPEQRNKFEGVGFATRLPAPRTLRRSS